MTESIIVAIITGTLSLLGVMFTNIMNNRKIQLQLEKSQAITETKLQILTDKVEQHNGFGSKIPVIEEQIREIWVHIHKLEDT